MLASIALLLATAACTSEDSKPRAEPAYALALRPKVEAIIKEGLVPGRIVVVRSKERGDWSATFGTRRLGGNEPIGIDDHFRIASNTKTMTGTVILQLVREGKLRLVRASQRRPSCLTRCYPGGGSSPKSGDARPLGARDVRFLTPH